MNRVVVDSRFIRACVALVVMLSLSLSTYASGDIDKQRQVIAALEKQVAAGEREVASLRKNMAAHEDKARALARQVEARNRLLTAQQAEERHLRGDIAMADKSAAALEVEIESEKAHYAKMVRGAYRAYNSNSMLMYLFLSEDFQDMARRVANMRAVAILREKRIDRIDSLTNELSRERSVLVDRREKLEGVVKSLAAQKASLQRDVNNARANIKSMSAKERKVLQQRVLQQRQLDVAIKELQVLIKNNQAGANFTAKSRGLRLPVQGGRVKQYKENMAEIVGAKGSKVTSIFDGKVVDVRMNRITGKYDVYMAHGEYITSYAGLSEVSVAKDSIVARDGVIGVIGEAVDIITMVSEYKIVFGVYPPKATERMSAANCFKH